ncbi:hypothetical protein BGX28_001146 [Mortierella sp. GBA30]|nr:hypothetical protein BGX28_001146 [Mortierella sp. GBA30]
MKTSKSKVTPSSDASRVGRFRPQLPPARRQPHPLVQQHQPFPSSTSSFSLRHSSSSSSLFGPNDSTRISVVQGTSHNSSLSNNSYSSNTFSFTGQHHGQPSSYDSRAIRSQSFVDPGSPLGTRTGSATTGARDVMNDRPKVPTAQESAGLLDSTSNSSSFYQVNNGGQTNIVYTPDFDYDYDYDDDSQAEDEFSYFGTAGQDYMLKKKRARRAKTLCWLDLAMLTIFTSMACLNAPGRVEGGDGPASWTWSWERISWPLTAMALIRILLMSFTARYSHGNYNAAVIFVCVLITLFTMFEVNMTIQHRLDLSALLITQYAVSTLLTQLHWITYSAHTPMSAALAYYDPLLTDSITFSRESRCINPPPYSRSLAIAASRSRTSYGTINGSSPFDALQEMDEEELEGDDDDVFIKVNVNLRPNPKKDNTPTVVSHNAQDRDANAHNGNVHDNDREDQEEDAEEQDMATLLAFQDARRQQVYAFSPTASSSAMPVRSILSPQALPRSLSNPNRTPLSWAFCAGNAAHSSSYDMRMAASGTSGAAAVAGGLTVGYTPRKRALKRASMDASGTGRRTWTGGHSIIYSGIFVEDSDEDDIETRDEAGHEAGDVTEVGDGTDTDVTRETGSCAQDDAAGNNEKLLSVNVEQEQEHALWIFDGTVKAEFDDNIKVEAENTIKTEIIPEYDDTIKAEINQKLDSTIAEVVSTAEIGLDDAIRTTVIKESVIIEATHKHSETCDSKEVRPDEPTDEVAPTDTSETQLDKKQEEQSGIGQPSGESVVQDDSEPSALDLAIKATDIHMRRPHFKDPDADIADQEAAIDISTPAGEPNGRHVADRHHPHHGLSTLKFNVSSHKEITAVVCEEDDCEDHPFQEGPAAELEAAVGSGIMGGNIVQLDIKESSTSSVERTGDGISDFEESWQPDTIRDTPGMSYLDGTDAIPHKPIAANCDHNNEDNEEEEHGSRKIHVRQRTETMRVELETDGPFDPTNARIGAIIAGLETPESRSTGPVTTIDEHAEGEGGYRRIHVRERIEQITVEDEDTVIGIVRPGGSTVGGVVDIIDGVAVEEPPRVILRTTKPLPLPPQGKLIPVPGQWIDVEEIERPSGVISWGIADDVPLSVQEGYGIEIVPEPAVYVPRQRPAIVRPLPPNPVMVERPPESLIAVGPVQRTVVIPPEPQRLIPTQPAARPVFQPQLQPRTVMRPQPSPVVYAPSRRPVLAPPPRPVPPRPAPVIQQPVPRVIAPQPQVIIQEQPQILPPAIPAILAPDAPPILAPAAPIIHPEYGTYETIVVPGAVGIGDVGAWQGGIAGPLQRRHSIASIYEDRSIASIYEVENRSVASAYGDHVVSIDGMGAGVPGRQTWMRGRPLSGVDYGHHYHLASAAHIAAPEEPQRQTLRVDHKGGMVWDSESGMYVRNRHVARHSDPLTYDDRSAYSEYLHSETDAGLSLMESSEERRRSAAIDGEPRSLDENRHAALPSDEANREVSYQEMELVEGPTQLQEMAIETYFDTTKSQMKVREQKGQLLTDMVLQLKKRQRKGQQSEGQMQEQTQQPSDRDASNAPTSSATAISLLSRSLQSQQHPPTLNIPKPPSNPPPVRLLMNRSKAITSPLIQPRGIPMVPRSPAPTNANVSKADYGQSRDDDTDMLPIMSSSSNDVETIMLQARPQNLRGSSAETSLQDRSTASLARTLISGAVQTAIVPTIEPSGSAPTPIRHADNAVWAGARSKDVNTTGAYGKQKGFAATTSTPTPAVRKALRKQHIPPMSRHHLHPVLLTEGITACWNNEFGSALETFKKYAGTYPRWSLAAAEVHITRQLISGQLSEADSELTDALLLSEKVASRILDKRQELDSSFMGYRSICSADATLITANDSTLRQNYKWDCEMAFYDTLLYRGILQLTSAPDTKGTFSDIKGGLQLRRAWKGYMRIKQEMEIAKEKWQKLSVLVEVHAKNEDCHTGGDSNRSEQENNQPLTEVGRTKNGHPPRSSKSTSTPVAIPPGPKGSNAPLSTSQPSDGSRWSLFGRSACVSHSAASLSTSPTQGTELTQENGERTRSRFLGPSNPKGLASALREQAKAAEEFKTAVRVLDDIEDYLQYGIGLFFFIVSIVPRSLLPALRTIGLQSNHEQGIKSLEAVFTHKNGRAPFAALFLLINYLFLPRGMNDPSISLGRAGEITSECLKTCPNGSSYLLMACQHARKTGNMIPAALNHITRGIQTCEAAGIPSINYRFELGLTFFINQEFGKAADIFEILWRRFTMTVSIGGNGAIIGNQGRHRKGRSSSIGSSLPPQLTSTSNISPPLQEEEEEDEFELAPFCGLCLIAGKVIMRLGQEGYFEYGRDGFGHHGGEDIASPSSSIYSDGVLASKVNASGSTTPLNFPRTGPEFDLLMAAQEVLAMMAGCDPGSSMKSTATGSIFEHSKTGSSHSTWSNKDTADGANLHLQPPPTQAGKLNRFNKFAWNQCQKSLQRGRISPFLPLVILYLRRDLAYMKPSVPQPADGDTHAIYLLLSAVVHRQLLPDDSTFAYTALTDCLLLESTIESEMWVIPHCHYELGELLYKKLHLPQAALEQFQWVVKGPGKEARPTSIFYTSMSSNSNPRLSVYGGGFPSDSVTNMIESAAAASQQTSQTRREGSGHSSHPSTASNHRLSQLFLGGSPPAHVHTSNPPNPVTFYNSRYKKFDFAQVLRHRSSICIEQIQKVIDSADFGSASSSHRTSMNGSVSNNVRRTVSTTSPNKGFPAGDAVLSAPAKESQRNNGQSLKRHSSQSVESRSEQSGNIVAVKSARLSSEVHEGETPVPSVDNIDSMVGVQSGQSWNSSTLPNILSDAQRKRGSQQLLGLGGQQLRAAHTVGVQGQ